jgi:hypothetical protein
MQARPASTSHPLAWPDAEVGATHTREIVIEQ